MVERGARFLLVAALAVACSTSKAGMSKHALTVVGEDAKVNVELAVPGTWRTDASDPPAWTMTGARMLSLAAVSPGGGDDASRVAGAIKMQYADLTGAVRADYPDGRVWIVRPEGENIYARMFVPFGRGVVMGVAVLEDASQVAGVKAAFETLRIAP